MHPRNDSGYRYPVHKKCPLSIPKLCKPKEVFSLSVRYLSRCALFAALFCLCAWMHIPVGDIAITLQTFALFCALFLLGGKGSTIVCCVYLLLGAVGLPVFSGFRGGVGVLLGATGGYIFGFLAATLTYWALTAIFGSRIRLYAAIAGLAICYACGSAWFLLVWLDSGSAVSLGFVLAKCVVPYVLPDCCKLLLAWLLSRRLKPHLS